jgi:diadenosine tetraphosphate (Ap4A) HIT family hydrolase
MNQPCLICDRIKTIQADKNHFFVRELTTGYVVIGDHQFYEGYTLFLCKQHTDELHKLEPQFRQQYLKEMSIVAEAVHKAFKPRKLNYELLGNTESHLHWHLIPRHANDPSPKQPIWVINAEIRTGKTPSAQLLTRLKNTLKRELDRLV